MEILWDALERSRCMATFEQVGTSHGSLCHQFMNVYVRISESENHHFITVEGFRTLKTVRNVSRSALISDRREIASSLFMSRC